MSTQGDLADEVRRGLATSADQMTPTAPPLDRALRRSRVMKRRRRAGAMAASVAGVVAVVGAVSLGLPEPRVDVTPIASSDAEVARMPTSPLSARAHASIAWTSAGLFVWGGKAGERSGELGQSDPVGSGVSTNALDDGAVFDPRTRAWRSINASPLEGRAQAPAVAMGDSVLVAGGTTPDGRRLRSDAALYLPGSDEWTEVPDAPTCPQHLVSEGRFVVALGSCDPGSTDAARWDSESNTWAALPDSGLGIIVSAFELRGKVFVIDESGRLRSLEGADWTDLPEAPTLGELPTFAAAPSGLYTVVGEVEDNSAVGVVYRLDGASWTEVARGPDLVPNAFAASATTVINAGFVWGTNAGLCRWDGATASCVKESPEDGLTRFKTTYVLDKAETLYLWGGDYVARGETSSGSTSTGTTVAWP